MPQSGPPRDDALLAEQVRYYRAVADQYEDHAIPDVGAGELMAALDAFGPSGHILELACGPGVWTPRLLRDAQSLTAVDASPEMLARARARVGGGACFICADIFSWEPERRYDTIFFGFWVSHVPRERFASFWSLVDGCLAPNGRVFFMDDAYRPVHELIEGPDSSTVQRRLNDGTPYRIVKVPHAPPDLERQLAQLGWDIRVRATSGPFYWGAGTRAAEPTKAP